LLDRRVAQARGRQREYREDEAGLLRPNHRWSQFNCAWCTGPVITGGLRENQDVTFLTDGGENTRSDEICYAGSRTQLDWFHITMHITVLSQYVRGVAQHDDAVGKSLLTDLERIKWLLWHGNQSRAGETIKFFLDDVDALEVDYPNLTTGCGF
jgi:hypothetical protein